MRYLDTLIRVPPYSTRWPDMRNEFFSIIPLTPVECSINTTCYTSIYFSKAWPWHKQGPGGAWKPTASLHPAWSCLSPSQRVHGQDPCDQGKGGFYQLHESQCSGPMFCKTCVWQMTPCGLQKSRWRKFSKCNVRILHLLIPTCARGQMSRSGLCVHRTLQHGCGSGATFNSSRQSQHAHTLLGLGIARAGRSLSTYERS